MKRAMLPCVMACMTFFASCWMDEDFFPRKANPFLDQTDLFVGGEGGYHTYRIPALIVTPKGTVLAFCEARKNSASDTGDIDTVVRRSTDGGRTWRSMQIVWDDGPNTAGNPCPVVDRDTGTIWLPLTHNLGADTEKEIVARQSKGTRTVWMTKSTDDGATWATPWEITATAKRPNWTWYATGPGVGIQLKNGRLVIPCDNKDADSKEEQSHILYSDDHGATWQLGGVVSPNVNECQVVELPDGTLMLNMRSYMGKNRRAVAFSRDGGLTWTPPQTDPNLIEPVCQASLIAYTGQVGNRANQFVLLFSNPASTKRENMTVRVSFDEGKTWPVAKSLYGGPSAYSCLAVLPDGTIGCLYERGEKRFSERITFARFNWEWLMQ